MADWIIDLGPGVADGAQRHRGVRGGEILAEGAPETVAEQPGSYAGQYLKPILERQSKAA